MVFLKTTIMILSALPTVMAYAAESAPDCSNTINKQDAASNEYMSALDDFNLENPPDDYKPQACIGGTVRWDKTSFKMDVPEFNMKQKSWKMDIPETKMVNQTWWIKEPYVKCENKKTGQYPETYCEDTWIKIGGLKTKGVPKCTVKWSDIITKVCWPETRDKRVVVGVPELKMVSKKMSMDIPEVTMKTREFSLHVPQFYAESGCMGGECSKKCKDLMDDHIENIEENRTASLKPSKENLIVSTSELFQCQGNSVRWQKDHALVEFDKYIVVAKTTLESMKIQGLVEPAKAQEVTLNVMVEQRKKMAKQMDDAINDIEKQEKVAIQKLSE